MDLGVREDPCDTMIHRIFPSMKAAKANWALNLFGKLSVVGHSQSLDQFSTKRSTYLLARLALSHRRAFTRTDAAELLWPDDFFDATRLRLRQELTRLRRSLGPARDILHTDEEWIRLAGDELEIDVRSFEEFFQAERKERNPELREGYCREAIALSTEPFLEGYEEDWIDVERARLAQIRYSILIDLAGLQSSRGDHEAALATANEAIVVDPGREAGHLLAMQELGKLGHPSDALGQYQQLKRVLRDEYAEAPSQDAERVASELREPKLAVEPRAVGDGLNFTVPASTEPIYGRDEMLNHLRRLLDPNESAHRLVSLIGPGGIGKTRLAMQAAMLLRSSYSCRVGWINLADIGDPASIPTAVAAALGVTLGPSSDPAERIAALLPTEPTLLVLDNLENLVPDGLTHVRALSEARPALRLLMTSRVALNLAGERLVTVGPLPLPKEEDSIEQPAIRVLLEGLLAEPDFKEPDRTEFAVLRQIAEKLEGIPLALQLASGQLRVVAPSDLLGQLGMRLDIVNRRVDAPERHRTIRTTIAGSFQVLPPDLQKVMGRLSVFRGGWNQAAAASVCEFEDPLPALETLLDYSLIRVDREDKGLRFRMLEGIRDYVMETIPAGDLSEAHAKHAQWLIHLGRPEMWRDQTAETLEHFKTIDLERDNIREAARYSLEHDLESAVALGATFGSYWVSRSLVREAKAFYAALFEHLPDLPVTASLARVSYCEAQTLYILQAFTPGDSGLGVSQRTARLCQETGLDVEYAMCLVQQSRTEFMAGQFDESLALISEAEKLLEKLDSPHDLATANQNRAMVLYYQGQVRVAIANMEAAMSLIGVAKVPFHQVQNSMMLSFMYLEVGELSKSKDSAYRALELAESYGFSQFIPMIQEACGKVAQAEGDLDLAAQWYRVSASSWDVFGNVYQHADQLHLLARVHLARKDPQAALPLITEAARMWEGKGMVAVVPCTLTSMAKTYLLLGDARQAARYMGVVKAIPTPTRDSGMASEATYVAEIVQDLEAALGADEVVKIFADSPDLETALQEAFH